MWEPKPWQRIAVGIIAGVLSAAITLILVAVSYAFVGYDTFDSLGDNVVRCLFVLAPVVTGLIFVIVGVLWPAQLLRKLGRLGDAIAEVLLLVR